LVALLTGKSTFDKQSMGFYGDSLARRQARKSSALRFSDLFHLVLTGVCLTGLFIQTGCTSVPLTYTGSVSSYERLGPERGHFARSRTFADPAFLQQVRSVNIVPTIVSPAASAQVSDANDVKLVSNFIDRSLCNAMSGRFAIVMPGEPADLTVQATVTNIVKTEKAVAGFSKAVSLGTSAFLPVGVPRLPVGLGGLAVEAEAVDAGGKQRAAMVWSKGANVITTSARVSEVGDAYGVAGRFGKDFADLLAEDRPGHHPLLQMPSNDGIRTALGGKPKYASCERFGRATGVNGFVADLLGTPPSWVDKGANNTANTF